MVAVSSSICLFLSRPSLAATSVTPGEEEQHPWLLTTGLTVQGGNWHRERDIPRQALHRRKERILVVLLHRVSSSEDGSALSHLARSEINLPELDAEGEGEIKTAVPEY